MSSTQHETRASITIPSTLHYRPLPAPLAQAIKHDAPSVIRIVDTPGSYPCRRCLQDGQVGDRMRLLSYDPWLGASPYRQPGPIFVHEEPICRKAEFPVHSTLPEQQRKRELSIRAFDREHMMVAFDTIQGEKLVSRVEEIFEQAGGAEYVHVHYAGPGCFAVRIDRA
ncbi:hypothetical protein BDY17DRAFT_325670 [Neohortaea acidophila]|uniref:DUF1203 domain-containing protein n=1 Tax=Neohortaea acidophila TaxID=245834 RepID=A0A6A6PQ17_9PEZI|nr:uncharacterized protein BDY17DRAFT_325670 [Neohortaea acidophila]KAF2482189.1 hypothetical protein BDY17DRAFT_325670 [Neohortaea acidophila]